MEHNTSVAASKKRALGVVKAGVYVCVGHIVQSIGLPLQPLRCSPLWLLRRSGAFSLGSSLFLLSCVQCTASQLRAGRDSVSAWLKNVLGLRFRVSLRLLSFSVPPGISNKSVPYGLHPHDYRPYPHES